MLSGVVVRHTSHSLGRKWHTVNSTISNKVKHSGISVSNRQIDHQFPSPVNVKSSPFMINTGCQIKKLEILKLF